MVRRRYEVPEWRQAWAWGFGNLAWVYAIEAGNSAGLGVVW